MRFLFLSSIFILCLGLTSSVAQAQSSSFGIHISGPDDVEAPSTPVLNSATPVAATQINLSWSSSTDNSVVSGYAVLRDGVSVATTSLTVYADVGLLASTTYSYVIRAFDPSLNYSSTSNSLSATTLDLPPEVVQENPQASIGRVVLDSLFIETGESTSSLSVKTALPARIEIRWGRTTSYELGYVVGGVYKKDFDLYLSDLEPNTVYLYEIVGYTPRGNEEILKTGSFTTKSDAPATPPSNVARFLAIPNGDDVELSWQNPNNSDFSYVRVVRSYINFPEYPSDGSIVYQGQKTKVSDVGVLDFYSPLYYTAFVYDIYGNVSSGAIAKVYAEGEEFMSSEFKSNSVDPLMEINQERVSIDMKMPLLSDIYVQQFDNTHSMMESLISLTGSNNFVVSIPVEAMAGNLKSIILTIVDPTDNRKDYSYLLRINNDRSAYVSTVPSLNVLGESDLKIEIYDYEAFVVGTYKTSLEFVETTSRKQNLTDSKQEAEFIFYFVSAGILLFLSVASVVFWRRLRKSEDKNNEE